MKSLLLIFIVLLLNGCNTENNNVFERKNEIITNQNELNNEQIIKDKERIRYIIKEYNNEKIKPDNHFKKERDELIEKNMKGTIMTKQMRDEYKKEYGYYPSHYDEQIIKDKERIRYIIKEYNNEKIKPDTHFKKERDELIERNMKVMPMTQQMKDEYKKEYGYYPFQYYDTNNKDYSTKVLGVGF